MAKLRMRTVTLTHNHMLQRRSVAGKDPRPLCISAISLNNLLTVRTSLQLTSAKAAFLFRENVQILFLTLEDLANTTM